MFQRLSAVCVLVVLLVVGFMFMQPSPAMAADPINITLGEPIHLPEQNVLRLPVYVDQDLTGMGIIGLQGDVEISDTSVYTLEYVMMTGATIVHADNIYHQWNTGKDGLVRFDWNNTLPLKGSGLLFFINLKIVGQPGETARVMLQAFSFFNGVPGDETLEVTNRDVTIPEPGFTARGQLLYLGMEDRPVGFDSLVAEDSSGTHVLDASSGAFEYQTEGGSTTFTGSKSPQLCTMQQSVITAYDGALAKQCVVGMIECDLETADVWADGWLSGFDAGLISWCGAALQYGLPYSLGTFLLEDVATPVEVSANEPVTLSVKLIGDLSKNLGQPEVAMASVASVEDTTVYTQVLMISSEIGFFTVDFEVSGDAEVPDFYEGWSFTEHNGRVVGNTFELVNSLKLPISVEAEEIYVHLDNHGAFPFDVKPRRVEGEIFLPSVVNN